MGTLRTTAWVALVFGLCWTGAAEAADFEERFTAIKKDLSGPLQTTEKAAGELGEIQKNLGNADVFLQGPMKHVLYRTLGTWSVAAFLFGDDAKPELLDQALGGKKRPGFSDDARRAKDMEKRYADMALSPLEPKWKKKAKRSAVFFERFLKLHQSPFTRRYGLGKLAQGGPGSKQEKHVLGEGYLQRTLAPLKKYFSKLTPKKSPYVDDAYLVFYVTLFEVISTHSRYIDGNRKVYLAAQVAQLLTDETIDVPHGQAMGANFEVARGLWRRIGMVLYGGKEAMKIEDAAMPIEVLETLETRVREAISKLPERYPNSALREHVARKLDWQLR